MKFLRRHRFIVFLVSCFIIGFITMPLFHGGYFSDLMTSIKNVKWYFHILLFIGTFMLTILLHELAHFLTFIAKGYKNEVLIILFLIFYKSNNKWRVKIDFKLLILGGGMAYPTLGEINDENDFIKAKNAMLSSLLVAPVFTFVSGFVLLLLSLVFFYKIPYLVVIAIYTSIFSFLFTYSSTKETKELKGDFKAYQRVKNDDEFALLILLQYADSTLYLSQLVKDKLLFMNKNHSLKYLSFLSYLIEDELLSSKIDIDIYNYVYDYSKVFNFRRLLLSYEGFSIAQSLLFYFHKCNFSSRVEKLIEIYKNELLKSKLKDKNKEFLLKQTLHLLNIENHFEYINNANNIHNNNLSFITKHIPSIIESEIKRNEGIEPFALECKI